MENPDKRAQQLVRHLADALANYHGERLGNFGCHCQAASILIESGLLRNYKIEDFFSVKVSTPLM